MTAKSELKTKHERSAALDAKVKPRLDTSKILEQTLFDGLPWKDSDAELRGPDRTQYALLARTILESKLWQNEINQLMDSWLRSAMIKATTPDEIADCRMCVAAIKLLEDRLIEIASWAASPDKPFDAHEAI